MEHPKLRLPKGLIVTNSSKKIKENRVDFEYVLQATDPGRYYIADSKLFYFDPHIQEYNQLDLNSLSLIVEKDITNKATILKNYNFDNFDLDNEDEKSHLNSIKVPNEIPKSIFWIIFLLAPIIAFIAFIYEFKIELIFYVNRLASRLFAKLLAKKELKYLLPYDVLINFISRKTGLDSALLSNDVIIVILKNKKLEQKSIDEFEKFLQELLKAKYDNKYNNLFRHNLSEKTVYWVKFLSKKL